MLLNQEVMVALNAERQDTMQEIAEMVAVIIVLNLEKSVERSSSR